MYVLYKSEFRIMIVKLLYHHDSYNFQGEIVEMIDSSKLSYEWMRVGNEYNLTIGYIIDQNESLKNLKENMYISLL